MRDCLILQDVLRVSLHMPLKKKCKLVLGPFLCIIRYYSLGLFLCFYESLATAVLFTSLFHTSFAVCVAAHRHLINICWVNELTFLKGHSCKRGSSLKVYNLENINYVEMVYVMGLKSIPEKKKKSVGAWVAEVNKELCFLWLLFTFICWRGKVFLNSLIWCFWSFPNKKCIELEVILSLAIVAVNSGHCVTEPCRIFLEYSDSLLNTNAGLSWNKICENIIRPFNLNEEM